MKEKLAKLNELTSTSSFEELQKIKRHLNAIIKIKNSNYPDIPGWKRTIRPTKSCKSTSIGWEDLSPNSHFNIECDWYYNNPKQKYFLRVYDSRFRSGIDINLLVNWREELELFKSQLQEEGFTIIPKEYYTAPRWYENIPTVMVHKPGTNPIL
jgi:hypothetical protein